MWSRSRRAATHLSPSISLPLLDLGMSIHHKPPLGLFFDRLFLNAQSLSPAFSATHILPPPQDLFFLFFYPPFRRPALLFLRVLPHASSCPPSLVSQLAPLWHGICLVLDFDFFFSSAARPLARCPFFVLFLSAVSICFGLRCVPSVFPQLVSGLVPPSSTTDL